MSAAPGGPTAPFTGPLPWEHPVWSPGERLRIGTVSRSTVPTFEEAAREIHLYRPDPAAVPRRLLVLFDAEKWIEHGVQSALDRWSADDTAVAMVASISPERRSADLPYPARAASIVRDEVLPVAAAELGRLYGPDSVVVAGQSYGGLASAAIVAEHPEVAATGIAQSPSFHFIEGETPRPPTGQRGSLSDRLPRSSSVGRLIVTAGTGEDTLLDQARIAVAAMSETDLRVRYREFVGGHDYAWWRHGLFWALDALESDR